MSGCYVRDKGKWEGRGRGRPGRPKRAPALHIGTHWGREGGGEG